MHSAWFIVAPNRAHLIRIGGGQVRPIIDTTFSLAETRRAFEQGVQGQTRGKIVLMVVDEVRPG